MNIDSFTIALIAQTGAIVWFASSIATTVKQMKKMLEDHEARLRTLE